MHQLSLLETIVVRYGNGEMETVSMGKIKPYDDIFEPPTIGSKICVHSRGGSYTATVEDILQEVSVLNI